MTSLQIINSTRDFVRKKLEKAESGHDWYHIQRVTKLAKYIGEKEKADLYIVELAALLHDIADWKFYQGDSSEGPKVARKWLTKLKVDKEIIDHVAEIISEMSFKGARVISHIRSLEGKVVQDADRLDAQGAIGIARAFSYGGYKQRLMYDPKIKPVLHKSATDYINSESTTINHFYEKLLLLKDRLNTKTARTLAKNRHKFMEEFLEEFYKEWNFNS